MFFLNLSAGEFFGLLGVLGGTITALYFLDRSKRRKVVSTLQFWVSAATASEQRSRKKVNQPWSLLLQLLSLALLLLAIAQLQWGTRTAAGRDHVVLLDTSAWSGASGALASEVRLAGQYLANLPAQDRVLLARCDALTVPVTVFTNDREQLQKALREATTSYAALDLNRALEYARQAQRWSGGASGEIVYIGPQMVMADAAGAVLPGNLRVLPVEVKQANAGVLRLDVRRGEADPGSWHAQVTLMNYGTVPETVRLRTQFAGTRFAERSLALRPKQEVTAEYNFVTNTAGQLTAEIEGEDGLPSDNRASLELPGNSRYEVTVLTRRAEVIKPLLMADRRIVATYLDPAQTANKTRADLVIVDEAEKKQVLGVPSIWINPAQGASPVEIKTILTKAAITEWNATLPMATGLHAHEDRMAQVKTFAVQTGDLVLARASASGGEGPAVVLRSGANKVAVIGFDPLNSHMRFSVTTPLLFANLLDWMAPEAVRANDLQARRVGSAAVTLEPDERAGQIRLTTENGMAVPFTVHERTLQLFAAKPVIARIVSGSRERILSLTLPDVARVKWTPAPGSVATGIPGLGNLSSTALDLWQWLACLGGLGLLVEWLLFGRARNLARAAAKTRAADREEELVAQ